MQNLIQTTQSLWNKYFPCIMSLKNFQFAFIVLNIYEFKHLVWWQNQSDLVLQNVPVSSIL